MKLNFKNSQKLLSGAFALVLLAAASIIISQPAKAASVDFTALNTALAATSTDSLDLTARQNILIGISDNSQTEIDGLAADLNALDLDDSWGAIRDRFVADLSDFKNYYKEFENKVNAEDITLADIKALAKELKDWREQNYTPELKEITNMTLIFQDESFLQTAHGRLDKVSADIKKMDKQNIIKTDALKNYFVQANKKLIDAEDSKNNGKNLFFASMNNFFGFTTSTVIITVTKDNSSSTRQVALKKITAVQMAGIQSSIRDLLTGSIKNIKAAYDIFFQMNNEINKVLQ